MSLQQLVSKKLQLESKWATQALGQGRVTTDMKWIDIEIKDLKKKINEQSVDDAKAGLLDIAS
tara:strand:+ start:53 stop:241 length:189 start_codon:yes stop_codon:yes gene_type:complete